MFWLKHNLDYLFLPYRYFNEFLVLYSDFSDSRQTDLMRFPYIAVVSHTTRINGLFPNIGRLLFVSHKDSAFDFSMMIHRTELLIVSIFSFEITFKQKLLSNPISRIGITHYHVSRQN